MASQLYQRVNYRANIPYLTSCYVREYDISKANITILLLKGVISKELYDQLYVADRMTRQVYVGNLQKDKQVANALKEGIIEAKKMFFEANNIEDHEVLAIKNDAVFIINRVMPVTEFGILKFVNKNTYTSFYYAAGKEYYYYLDPVKGIENIDIKGINDKVLVEHKEYFLDFLLALFYTAQTQETGVVIEMLQGFYSDYINRKLPLGYYREFKSESSFRFSNLSRYSDFTAKVLPENCVSQIDISYNANILREFFMIFSNRYFK